MKNSQKIGGIAALFEAIIYVMAFVFYGALLDFPANAALAEKYVFLSDNQAVMSIMNLIAYVVFGIFLAILVLALHERIKASAPFTAQVATVFGLVWAGMVMASGMIANIGLGIVIDLSATEPEHARSVWLAVDAVVEGLGGGNEIAGGLWVLLVSTAALKGTTLPRLLNYLGIFVGLAGILTAYPAEVITEIFGLSQIVWFAYLGVIMLRNKPY